MRRGKPRTERPKTQSLDRGPTRSCALPETARIIGVALNYQKRGKNESYYYYYSSDDSSSSNGNTPPPSNGTGRTLGQKMREMVPGGQTGQS